MTERRRTSALIPVILSPRRLLLAAAAVFAAAIAFQAFAIATTWGPAYWPFGSVAASLVCALALVRRRWPTGTVVAAIAVAAVATAVARGAHLPSEPSPAMTLGLALLAASALRTFPAATAGAVAGGVLAVAVAGGIAARTSSGNSAVANLNLLGSLAAVTIGLALRLSAARGRAAADRVRREERLALAREMHDVVAHHIASLLIQTQAAQVVARRRPGDVPRTLTDIESTGAEALAAMRRSVALLRDTGDAGDIDDAAPLSSGPESLDDLVHRFGRSGPTVRLRGPGDDHDWPPEVTGTVYRVVQESLTNVARHAPQAGSVAVTVRRDGDRVGVEVVDDAPHGTRPRGRAGFGLLGMRERVEALGGTLDAGPGDGAGWAVRAVLPVPPSGRAG
ncbi:sensor histidine kinase [Actinomadura harenae]|uniref:histidine kinase n=1 Tax=Actinomadura harenae TaxID=2483351 RepID=A0A3M2LTF7_9ACTN|nr:sensor histidine kinase [Actinomadura harenae]RMI38158.1 sensor histidine kinase [Actinomadura harenae]